MGILKDYISDQKTLKNHKIEIDNCVKNIVEKERRIEIKRILEEIRYLRNNTSFTLIEFFMYDFAHKKHSEWYDYIPDKFTRTIYERLNVTDHLFNSRDKFEVYKAYKSFFKRDACKIINNNDKECFASFLKEKQRILIKPLEGSLGDDIYIIDYKNVNNLDDYFTRLLDKYKEGAICEEIIIQDNCLSKLNPTSVNTLRVTTIRMDDRVIAQAFLRVGKMFSLVDNIAKGGIVCAIDQETGVITKATDKYGRQYINHPHTNFPLIGSVVPKFKEAIQLAKELAQVLPQFRYMGWDLALTKDGWVLVEQNAKAGIYCIQQTLQRGIRNDLESIFSELNKDIDFPNCFSENFK